MTSRDRHDRPDHAGAPTAARAGTISRRRLVIAGLGLAGVGAVGLGRRTGSPASASPVRAANVVSPAAALQPAVRVTTTTTVPDIEEGLIRFPVQLTEDDCAYVLDNFGDCRSGCSRLHEGVDIMGDVGLPIVAPTSGVLIQKYEDRGLTYGAGHGWTMHDEELDVTYRFFHLDSHEDGLEEGDEVEAGQVIGYLGNTGTSGVPRGDNFHLHFEFRPGDRAIDAFDLLSRDNLAAFAGEHDWCSPRLEPPEEPPEDPDEGSSTSTSTTTTTTTVPDPG